MGRLPPGLHVLGHAQHGGGGAPRQQGPPSHQATRRARLSHVGADGGPGPRRPVLAGEGQPTHDGVLVPLALPGTTAPGTCRQRHPDGRPPPAQVGSHSRALHVY